MTSLDAYATFLTARWDEIERDVLTGDFAQEGISGSGHLLSCWPYDTGEPFICDCKLPYLRADLAAKREILEWRQNWPVLTEEPVEVERLPASDVESHVYRASQQIQWFTEQEYVKRFGTSSPAAPILRLLAEPFHDHPDHPANREA